MCDVLQREKAARPKSTPYFDGTIEGTDTMKHRRSKFSPYQERRLKVLMMVIASRKLVLRPYFQDYEIVAKNDGRVTFAHFARILNFVGVVVSSEDLNLLMRRFVSDSCCVDYDEFICEVAKAAAEGHLVRCPEVNIDPQRMIDASPQETILNVGNRTASERTGKNYIGSSSSHKIDVPSIMRKIQQHITRRRIRTSEIFQVKDVYNTGKISSDQFTRGLDVIGVGHCRELSLTPAEVRALLQFYGDPDDERQVCWKTFADDVDQVFSIKNLEKYPEIDVKATLERRSILKKTNDRIIPPRIRQLIKYLGVNLKTFFENFDRYKSGRVSNEQLQQVLVRFGLRYPIPDLDQLQENFEQYGEFDYIRFLQELENEDKPCKDFQVKKDFRNTLEAARWPEQGYEDHEKDISAILAYIKNKVSRERIRLQYFFEQYDPLKTSVISQANFHRGISSAGIRLTSTQLDTIMDVFGAPMRRNLVEYVRLCRVLEECFSQPGLEQTPLMVPVQHLASEDCGRNFLSHPERALLTSAMEKLARTPDVVSNISEVFNDCDLHKCGSISKVKFKRSLNSRNMLELLTDKESDVVCKRFAVPRGSDNEVDYRRFSKALDILYPTVKNHQQQKCC